MPTFDVSVVGLTILDVLGRPVSHVPERGGVTFIDEIRLTVAGPAGGTAIDTAKLGLIPILGLADSHFGQLDSQELWIVRCQFSKRESGPGFSHGRANIPRLIEKAGKGGCGGSQSGFEFRS